MITSPLPPQTLSFFLAVGEHLSLSSSHPQPPFRPWASESPKWTPGGEAGGGWSGGQGVGSPCNEVVSSSLCFADRKPANLEICFQRIPVSNPEQNSKVSFQSCVHHKHTLFLLPRLSYFWGLTLANS